jgi:hypothetical protein
MSILLLTLCSRQKYKPIVTVCVLIGTIVLFPYLDFFRTADGYDMRDVQSPASQLTQKPDYDAFQMTSNSIASVEDKGFDYGRNLLGSILFFVPRSTWTNKPWGTGQRIGEDLQYRNTNLSCPLWAEFYYTGGSVAVFFGFLIYGLASRRIENLASSGTDLPIYLILSYAAGFQIFLLRGDLQNAIAYSAPSYLLMGAYFIHGTGRTSRQNRAARIAGKKRFEVVTQECVPVTQI